MRYRLSLELFDYYKLITDYSNPLEGDVKEELSNKEKLCYYLNLEVT